MFERYDDIVTVDQLCEMLKIGRNNAYALVNSGEIKSVRIGKQIRIPKIDVIHYLSVDTCTETLFSEE